MSLTNEMKISGRDATINALKEEISGLNKYRRMRSDRIAALEAENKRSKENLRIAEWTWDNVSKENDSLKMQLSDCQDMENKWHCAAKELMGTINKLNAELAELQDDYDRVNKARMAAESEVYCLRKDIKELREAAEWFANEELYLPDDNEEAEFNSRQHTLRAMLPKRADFPELERD